MNEGSGTVLIDEINGNNGSNLNGATYLSSPAPPSQLAGQVYSLGFFWRFNFATILDMGPGLYAGPPFTVSIWAGNATAGVQTQCVSFQNGAGDILAQVGPNGGQTTAAVADGAAAGFWQNGTIPINDGAFHNLIWTSDGSTGKLYVDGVLDISWATSGGNTGGDMMLGYSGGADFPLLCDLRIWGSVALDAAQCAAIAAGA